MGDELTGIEQDVPFDFAAAEALSTSADDAAGTVEGQLGSRNVFVSVAMQEFRGFFSTLFQDNASTAAADARELADRLREVAEGARRLAEEAQKEQERRETARAWKAEQDSRSGLEKVGDGIGDFFTGEDEPPVGPPASPIEVPVSAPRSTPRQTPASGTGGAGGTSSARPADLTSFATASAGADERARTPLATAKARFSTFRSSCHWGSLSADGVFSGADRWLEANENDVAWATTVASAFEAAGGDGVVSTLSNASVAAALQAAGVDAARQDLVIEPAQAVGAMPTSGYADDPVNTSTGNFLEPEADLGFAGGCASLAFTRMYNSMTCVVGALGPGWSSWADTGLSLDDEAARCTLPDGRQLVFPRLGEAWDRASGESRWLERSGDGYLVSGNDGVRWRFDRAGRLLARTAGPGTTVRLTWAEGRLVRMSHERGRRLELVWGDTRLLAVRASDGREVTYDYDDQDRLVAATSALGTRRYRWDEHGLVDAVIGSSGVVEVENTYDDRSRVTSQRSPHGRVTRYAYLPGRVTVVSDVDGTRSNTWVADERGRLVGAIDSDDRRQSTSYDPYGNAVMVTERDGSTTVREYDTRGRLVRTVSPNGADITQSFDDQDRVRTVEVATEDGTPAVTSFTYDGDERNPATLTDPEGGVTRMAWAAGLLTEVVDPTGVVVSFAYDEHGDLVSTTDADGNAARLERDDAGRVVAAVTPSGHRTTFAFDDATGLLRTRVDPDGATWTYEHTVDGRVSSVTDPLGARTTMEHGVAGDLETTVDPLGRAVSRHFDDLGNLAAVELPDGSEWRFAHDALSRLRETTDPTGAVWTRDYDANGDLVTTTAPTGEQRAARADVAAGTAEVVSGSVAAGMQFDKLGRLVASVRPDGSSVLTRYDRCGRAVELVDAAGGRTAVERDAAGRAVALTRPGGGVVSYEYDRCGRPSAVVDELGARTTMTYDADGRVVAQTMPTGEQATWRYDSCARVTKRRVPGAGTTLVTYDLLGRVVESRDPQFGRRRFRYDAAGQLVEAVDGNGGATRWEYDANGRAVLIVHPDGGETRREFDAMNRAVAQTDPLGRITRGGYDAAGRQSWQEDPTGTRTEWTYDENGRVTTVAIDGEVLSHTTRDVRGRTARVVDHTQRDREAVHELAWDARGLLVSQTRDGRGLSWSYDADGRRVARVDPDGRRTRYERDAAGRVVAVEHDALGRAAFQRDLSGRLVAADAGGVRQTWTFGDGFLAGHTVTDGERSSTTVVDRDDLGRITTVARDGSSSAYEHDEAHQLVALRTTGADGESATRWRYDASGRIVAEIAAGRTRELSYDAAGQLLTAVERDGDATRSTRFSYDRLGRRTRAERTDGSTRDLVWSRLGSLAEVVDRDPEGRERRVTSVVDALGQLSRLDDAEVFFDNADPRAGAPAQVGSAAVVATGPVLGVGTEWNTPGWRQVRATGDDPWDVDAAAGFDDHGIGLGASGELTFAGLEWMGRRVYDPDSHGFLSVDPWEPTSGAAWSGNPYAFAGNDPMHALDPSGLSPMTDADLQTYMSENAGAFAAVADWTKNNWEYLAGGAMVIAGGVLIATGVGGPAGMMLISAGADTIIQKATTGSVNWGQVAISGAFGAWGGVGAAARMGVTGPLRQAVVGGMISGGTGGGVSSAYGYATGPGPHTPGGFVSATAQGVGIGGLTGGAAGGAGHALTPSSVPSPTSSPVLADVPPTPAAPQPPTPGPRPTEGIYVVDSVDGVYVGQSNDIDRRFAEHVRDGKFTPAEVGNAARQEVLGGKTSREVAEQQMVDRLGGVDNLLNRVNPIGPARFHLMPDQPYSRP
ncbi:DUF6531 domain-containing protein [Nocardioides sp. AX2bis]|uniref:DUF6531 domain-containing protein n=1 Tax=Nocardioides sp. AX2bis TaxID=2653157 RepID=UPI0012F13DD1|nr:DUF6531 domain-containing protein [Nocardioides sp. AX2bis]VXC24794.1 conserved hypothetical protein [Nocardioides sp. AX2bis]